MGIIHEVKMCQLCHEKSDATWFFREINELLIIIKGLLKALGNI